MSRPGPIGKRAVTAEVRRLVRAHLAAGCGVRETARILRLSPATVEYHKERAA